jgi:hypothetical protein
MSLRDVLGTATDQVHERVDSLLDTEDALIMLIDGGRAISYAHGFGLSPSQLELLALEVERVVRRVAGPSKGSKNGTRNAAGNNRDSRRGPTRGSVDGEDRRPVGRLLRLARETPQAESV